MPQLTVIIPVYNEEKTIIQIIEKLLATLDSAVPEVQYIIVDDGSNDATKKLLTESTYSKDHRFTIIHQKNNQGKGSAIRAALPQVRGTYVVVQDADLEYSPKDILDLLAYACEHASPVVYGSRNLNKTAPHGTPLFYWGGRLLTSITNILFHQNLTDEACGYKLFSSELLRSLPLTCKRFEFCPEVTGIIAQRGIIIPEIAVDYAPRNKKEGKKITYRDGLAAITTLLRIKFSLRAEFIQAFFIFLFVLGIFFGSWNGSVAGYEPDTIDAAVGLIHGTYLLKKPAIGSSLFYIPFVYLSKLIPLTNTAKYLTLVPLFYSALTAVLIFLIANQLGIRRSISISVTILIAVGSLVWPYSKIGMEYQEMFLIGLILLTLIYWSKKQTLASLFLIGAEAALLTLTKSYGIVFILPIVLFLLTTFHHQGKSRDLFKLAVFLRVLLPTILVVSFLMAVNMLLAGKLSGAYTIGREFQIVSWWDGVWGIFFGFGKSILVYSPLLVISLFFWPRFHKKFPATSIFIITGFALYFLITAPFSYWSDETLSVRKLIPLIPFLHLPLFLGIDFLLTERKKVLLALVGIVAVIAIYVQMINGFYSYFRYIHIVRSGNVDSLEQMRYNPQVSQLYINHQLFVSYLRRRLFGVSSQYNYTEKTWMRHFDDPGAKDFILTDLKIDLNTYNVPSTYFFIAENKQIKNYVLVAEILLLGLVGWCLVLTVSTNYKQENVLGY